jgi:Flp pilus assembly CpaE family ATPase
VALALGDQELEQRLRPALDAAEDLTIVAQCLAADQLLQLVDAEQVDALVVAWSLHRLTDAVLDQLDRPGLVRVLLVPNPEEPLWRQGGGPVLGLDADAAAIRHALWSARTGVPVVNRRRAPVEPVPMKRTDRFDADVGGVIAVTGGAGSPGRTTVAINLATALSAGGPTVLVELDLCAPAIAAYLDRDPSRNICTLAHTVRDDPRRWDIALAEELQSLGIDHLSADVLCGPPKREMRASVAPPLVEELIAQLAPRYRWVILDVGAELLGTDAPAASHRTALARAHHVLLVATTHLVGLWHARTALDQLERMVGIERRRVSLVVNSHDARFDYRPREIEWHLGAPVAAVIPFDHRAMQRAIAAQRPLVLDTSSRAGRAIVALAERLHEGKLRIPPEGAAARHQAAWWRRVLRRSEAAPAGRRNLQPGVPRLPALQERRSRA